MEIVFGVFLTVFYLISPLGILYLCDKYVFVNKIGAVIIAYILGILLAGSGELQSDGINLIQEIIMSVTIPLGIPLLLFSSDLKKSFLLAKKTFISLFVALISVVIVVVVGYLWLRPEGFDNFYKVGGLLVGVYTGGTPNLAALKMVLNIDPDIYIAVHAYDMLISTMHLFFLMVFGKTVFEFVLPKFKNQTSLNGNKISIDKPTEPFWGLLQKKNRIPLIKALGIAIVIVSLAGGFMFLVNEKSQMVVFILSITTLAIGASFFTDVKSIPKTFEFGMYFILVFSVVVASKVQYEHFININPAIFYYITFVVFGSLFLHVLISRFFKIDADTVIITSAALICSPPFVPVVAGTLKNREIILPGITIGIIGYAIGNYLGYLISELLQLL